MTPYRGVMPCPPCRASSGATGAGLACGLALETRHLKVLADDALVGAEVGAIVLGIALKTDETGLASALGANRCGQRFERSVG